MTDRSVPFNLGKGTCIRYDRADIKAMESALGIGYPYFTRQGILGSLTSSEVYIWRGLRMEDEKGELVHVFPLNDTGKDQAGDAIMEYLQGNTDDEMIRAIVDGFVESGLFKRREPETIVNTEPVKEDIPKNLLT
jgi:hypothetical protein